MWLLIGGRLLEDRAGCSTVRAAAVGGGRKRDLAVRRPKYEDGFGCGTTLPKVARDHLSADREHYRSAALRPGAVPIGLITAKSSV